MWHKFQQLLEKSERILYNLQRGDVMGAPLADRIRPAELSDVVGQKHILSEGKILNRLVESEYVPNLIFYGPSGTGKTTVANIIARKSNKKLYKLNATTCSVSDVKDKISTLDGISSYDGVMLYLDEIQNFNKKQQQSLLEVIENGQITLIASTTENPYFYIYGALLSRCSVFEFKPVEPEEIVIALKRASKTLTEEYGKNIVVSDEAYMHFSNMCNGDVRKAVNSLEIAVIAASVTLEEEITVDIGLAVQATQKSALKYDKDGDNHYDVLSAFQKSVRGSDPDAAVHYLARLIASGDIKIICRRLLVIASEDIGLAYPMAASIVKSCCDSALQLGLPEARIPLSQATILLATAPKSNSAICAIDDALNDINSIDTGDIPPHLKDAHYGGAEKLGRGIEYKYPHAFENSYVKQQYLPDKIADHIYYNYGDNKTEQLAKKYWDEIKK